MTAVASIHPFPARMAPELALKACTGLKANKLVLDPMVGSGTTLRAASEEGHRGLGFDTDPLAVMVARVWNTPVDVDRVSELCKDVIQRARRLRRDRWSLLSVDEETRTFIEYWFAERQIEGLARLAYAMRDVKGHLGEVLKVGLSKIIITKDSGASLARDISHSRPHRTRLVNDYDVFLGFERAVGTLGRQLRTHPPPGNVKVELGDARCLHRLRSGSVDAVVTSPPYLNAIDYLRGHRLSLVWLGWSIKELRAIRSDSIGTERGLGQGDRYDYAAELCGPMGNIEALPRVNQRVVFRYALDMDSAVSETSRVLKRGGHAVFVVGNSSLRGVFIRNEELVLALARRLGLELEERRERKLQANRRYLPPPASVGKDNQPLNTRMATETILRFVKR